MSNLLTVFLSVSLFFSFFSSSLLVCSFFFFFFFSCFSQSVVFFPLFFFFFFLFFVVGLFLFSSFFQHFSFFFFLSRVSLVFELLHSASDSLFGRFYDRLFRLEIMHVAWTGLRHQIVLLLYIHMHAETRSTIMTNEHSSLKKNIPLTLYSKWLRKGLWKGCVWEVSRRLNRLQLIDTKFLCL